MKEQSQRRACDLIPTVVFNDRLTCKDRHAAEPILARRTGLHQKAEYIAADSSSRPNSSLRSRGGPCIIRIRLYRLSRFESVEMVGESNLCWSFGGFHGPEAH
jgi:hypothetical protein